VPEDSWLPNALMDRCLNDSRNGFTTPWLLQFAGARYATPHFADALTLNHREDSSTEKATSAHSKTNKAPQPEIGIRKYSRPPSPNGSESNELQRGFESGLPRLLRQKAVPTLLLLFVTPFAIGACRLL
jgi:hypothetical protein